MRQSSLLRFLLPALLLLSACEDESPPVERDLAEIQARDTLSVVTTYNSTSYFLYRGEPMGLEYELLQAFAKEMDVELSTTVVRDRERLLELLREGVGDVAAGRLVPSEHDAAEGVAFTEALYRTQPVLVQRAGPADLPPSVDSLLRGGAPATVRARLVASPAGLAGKKVFLPEDSKYLDRMVELSDSITGDIHLVEVESDVRTETLIRAVARGEIRLTVAQQNVAELSESYFDNLVVRPTLGPPHRIAWAVREGSPGLLAAFNRWIASEEGRKKVEELYETYMLDRAGYEERVASEYLTSETGRLSEYDPLFKEHARKLGWDWRLLASQAYQESQFKPTAKSWAGALGLLQLMPATAREVGVRNPMDPVENVQGSVRHTEGLLRYWGKEIADPGERLKFVLAAYNTGTGHVEDARRLTVKHGGNPQVWEDVAYWLLQKSRREVYTDPVVKYGFSRGLEPVMYVSRILERFAHYRQFVTG